jgi:hypothetical protein
MTFHDFSLGFSYFPMVSPRRRRVFSMDFPMGNPLVVLAALQMASAMYVVDTCSQSDGFVLRTGHMQAQPLDSTQT